MSKGINKILFFLFGVLLLVFFYRTAIFWMTSMTYEDSVSNRYLYISLEVLFILILALIVVNHSLYFRGIHLVCWAWVLCMFIALAFNNSSRITFFRCVFWPLLFEATYIFVIDSYERVIKIVRLYYLLGALGLYLFIDAMLFKSFGSQSNMIYFFVLTAPILLLKENKTWTLFVLIFTTIMAVVSMKRSMMLSMVVFWFVYFVGNGIRNRKHRLRTVFLAIVVLISVYYAFNFVDRISGGVFTSRFEMEDMSNGRNDIYDMTWEMQKHSSTAQWLFGHGDDAVRRNSYKAISAHNEWMEILYDYGAIVLLIYLCLWIALIKRWFFHYKTMSKYLTAYTLSLSILAVMSMVSQLVLYVSYFLYLVMFWAVVEALCNAEYINYRKFSH